MSVQSPQIQSPESRSPEAPALPRRRLRLGAMASAAVIGLGAVGLGGAAIAARGGSATTAVSSAGVLTQPTEYGRGTPRRQQGATLGQAPSGPTGTQETADADTTTATAANEVGMVEITSTLTDGRAAGTGMVLSSDGEVVTNHHVVAGATKIKVTVVSTGETYTARYVGANVTTDVAVLKLVGAEDLTTVDLAATATDADAEVTSVGDANGDGGSLTAATGTVSATDESITVSDDDGGTSRLTGLIEVAADLVPGDSGGALLDSSGEVVGMNVAASSGSAAVTGFAIPVSTVLSTVAAIDSGVATSSVALGYDGYLGIAIASGTTPTVAAVAVGSGAAAAGLEPGDTITAVDGTSVPTETRLHDAIAAHDPGDQVRITWTGTVGATHSATVTLGRAPIA